MMTTTTTTIFAQCTCTLVFCKYVYEKCSPSLCTFEFSIVFFLLVILPAPPTPISLYRDFRCMLIFICHYKYMASIFPVFPFRALVFPHRYRCCCAHVCCRCWFGVLVYDRDSLKSQSGNFAFLKRWDIALDLISWLSLYFPSSRFAFQYQNSIIQQTAPEKRLSHTTWPPHTPHIAIYMYTNWTVDAVRVCWNAFSPCPLSLYHFKSSILVIYTFPCVDRYPCVHSHWRWWGYDIFRTNFIYLWLCARRGWEREREKGGSHTGKTIECEAHSTCVLRCYANIYRICVFFYFMAHGNYVCTLCMVLEVGFWFFIYTMLSRLLVSICYLHVFACYFHPLFMYTDFVPLSHFSLLLSTPPPPPRIVCRMPVNHKVWSQSTILCAFMCWNTTKKMREAEEFLDFHRDVKWLQPLTRIHTCTETPIRIAIWWCGFYEFRFMIVYSTVKHYIHKQIHCHNNVYYFCTHHILPYMYNERELLRFFPRPSVFFWTCMYVHGS